MTEAELRQLISADPGEITDPADLAEAAIASIAALSSPQLAVRAGALLKKALAHDHAHAVYSAVAESFPFNPFAAEFLGRTSASHGDVRKAAEHLIPALRSRNANPALFEYAISLVRGGAFPDLMAAIGRLAFERVEPDAGIAAPVVATFVEENLDHLVVEAEASLPDDLPLEPETALRLLGSAHAGQSPHEAGWRLRAARSIASASGSAAMWTARLQVAEGDIAGAIETLSAGSVADPGDVLLRHEFVRLSLDSGEIGGCAAAILKIERDPDLSVPLAGAIGDARALAGACGTTIEHLAQAAQSWRSVPAVYDLICTRNPAATPDDRSGYLVVAGDDDYFATTIVEELSEKAGAGPIGRVRENLVVSAASRSPLDWLPPAIGERARAFYALFIERRVRGVMCTSDDASPIVGIAALLAGVPTIVLSVPGAEQQSGRSSLEMRDLSASYRALMRRTEVTAMSRSGPGLDDFLRWLDLPDARNARVISRGMNRISDTSAMRALLGISSTDLLIGTKSTFTSASRADWFVEIAASLSATYPDYRFVLIGNGSNRAGLQALVKLRKLDTHIHFVDDGVMSLRELDIFVWPCPIAAAPDAVVDAAAAGVPVVAIDGAEASVLVEDGVTGLLVGADDCDSLNSAIDAAAQERAWLYAARKHSRRLARARFARAPMIEEISALLNL